MKRKMYGMILVTLLMMVLTGCRMYADYTVNEDQTVTIKSRIAYPESLKDSIDTTGMTLLILEDGKRYYMTEEESTTEPMTETNKRGISLSEDIFFYRIGLEGEAVDTSSIMYMQLTLNMLTDIVDTNADKSSSGNKAVFSTDGKLYYWYAYTQKGKELIAADAEKPKMKGAKNGKYYKKMPTNIQFTDNIAVKDIKLNGQYVKQEDASSSSGSTSTNKKWVNNQGKEVSKNGKNVFKVTDLNGNTSTFTIYIDKKAPVVKGVKNKKTYKKKAVIYVKDNKKLSKITINGKKQKMTNKQLVKKGKYKGYYKYTVKKKGTNKIVVKDAAGNKKTLKIKIKK